MSVDGELIKSRQDSWVPFLLLITDVQTKQRRLSTLTVWMCDYTKCLLGLSVSLTRSSWISLELSHNLHNNIPR